MDRAVLKKQARETIKGKLWTLVAISIAVYFGEGILSWATSWAGAGGVGGLLVSGSVSLSLAMIYLGLYKNRKPQLEDILLGFKNGNFGRGLIGYLRYLVFSLLWGLLLIVPGVIKSFSYSQMFYLMADKPKLEPSEAQSKSMEMMEGHKWELCKLYLSFLPWVLLIIVTFGIALIYVVPYFTTTLAGYYNYVKKASR